MSAEGGALGSGAGFFFLGVWFLLGGWVTTEVWNVVGPRVGKGEGWPKARSRDVSQGARSPGPPTAQPERGPEVAPRAWPPPDISPSLGSEGL